MSHPVSSSRRVPWSELQAPFDQGELDRADLRRLCQPVGPQRGPTGEPALFLKGTLPTRSAVAVVGTRQPTVQALAFTREIVRAIADAGLSVVSGGARGIDRAAHAEALRQGAPTLVVMPCGLDVTYPPEHAGLYGEVVTHGGGLLSLWPDGTQPRQFRFIQRNRLLAALCVALVVVQAPLRSGARSAAYSARRLGRLVCAVPHSPWDERGAGCSAELGLGALPVVAPDDVIKALGGPLGARGGPAPAPGRPRPTPIRRVCAQRAAESVLPGSGAHSVQESEISVGSRPAVTEAPPLNETELHIIGTLDGTPRHQDELCDRAQLPFAQVAATLLTLTLRTVVVEGPAAHYRLT